MTMDTRVGVVHAGALDVSSGTEWTWRLNEKSAGYGRFAVTERYLT